MVELIRESEELYRQSKFAEAEDVAIIALKKAENTFGSNHATMVTLLNNLAVMYRAQERYSEAEPLFKRALTRYEKALGPDHPDMM